MGERSEMLTPGMFVEGVVTSQRKQRRWVVPRRAIRGGAIRTIQDGRVVSQPVEIAWVFEGRVPEVGLTEDRQWAALEGELSGGEMVLTSASSSVLDGQRVDPVLVGARPSREADCTGAPAVSCTCSLWCSQAGASQLAHVGAAYRWCHHRGGVRREFFPETQPEQALITMPYPGALPEEVETSLALKVEDAVDDLDEVDEIRDTLAEGGGGITVEFREGVDPDKALNKVQRAIDGLEDLPERAEEIQVELIEPRLPVIRVALFGDLDERTMKRGIRALRDDLRRLPNMGEIVIDGVRDYEVRVDVPQSAMLKHGLSINEISQRIGAWMKDVPGGTVQGESGNVKMRPSVWMNEPTPLKVCRCKPIPAGAPPCGRYCPGTRRLCR